MTNTEVAAMWDQLCPEDRRRVFRTSTLAVYRAWKDLDNRQKAEALNAGRFQTKEKA
jgi:hypothetical protein